MKVNKIVSALEKRIQTLKAIRHEKQISKYLTVDKEVSSKQIYDAREMLANYAKANGVKVSILKDLDASYSSAAKYTQSRINIVAETLPKKSKKNPAGAIKSVSALIPYDENAKFVHQTLNTKYYKKSNFEDTFLRTVYRRLSDCVNSLVK